MTIVQQIQIMRRGAHVAFGVAAMYRAHGLAQFAAYQSMQGRWHMATARSLLRSLRNANGEG